jgi:hypothetical protein
MKTFLSTHPQSEAEMISEQSTRNDAITMRFGKLDRNQPEKSEK